MNNGYTQKEFELPDSDMELINRFSRRKLKKDEVYTFGVILCDNEIDRDFECFEKNALEKIASLFVGKTGIFDHNPKADRQTARIFKAEVVSDSSRETSYGEVYSYVKATAYMLKTEANRDLILEIDGGIKKEVSVGLSVKKQSCSICRKPYGGCSHQKGETYGDKLCFSILSEPYDAYEWSFVAVPAQRNAGVTKAYQKGGAILREQNDIFKALDCEESVTFTKAEALEIKKEFERLRQLSETGLEFKKSLEKEITKLAFLAGDGISGKTLEGILTKLSVSELSELKKTYEKRLDEDKPEAQTAKTKPADNGGKINDFKI